MKRELAQIGWTALCWCALSLVCTAQGEEGQIIEDFKEIIMAQDEDSALYDQVLMAAGEYAEKRDEESLLKAKACMEETIGQFEARIEECQNSAYEMEPSFRELLMDYGINPEEYQMHADLRASYLVGYQDSTSLLLSILERGESGAQIEALFEQLYLQDAAVQEYMRKSHFYEINYFFCEWEEEAVESLEQEVLSKLQSFTAQGQPWETKKEAVEQKMTVYLEELEDVVEQLSGKIGEEQEKLYRMEAEFGG